MCDIVHVAKGSVYFCMGDVVAQIQIGAYIHGVLIILILWWCTFGYTEKMIFCTLKHQ